MEIELLNKVEETAEPIVEVLPPEPIIETMWVRQPTRDLLERYFAEKIMSLKHGLDEVYEPKASGDGETLTQLQEIQAYWNIVRTEVDEIVELFGSVQPATMNPNHRKVMKITKHYASILPSYDLIEEEDENSSKCLAFAKTAIKYLSTFHILLHNDKKVFTDKEKRDLQYQLDQMEAIRKKLGSRVEPIGSDGLTKTQREAAAKEEEARKKYFADKTEKLTTDLNKKIADGTISCVLTDPPYGIGFDRENLSMSCGLRVDGSQRIYKKWSRPKPKGYETGKKYFDWLFDGKGGQLHVWYGLKWKVV